MRDTKDNKDNITKDKDIAIAISGKSINFLLDKFKPLNPEYERFFKNTTERKSMEELVVKYSYDKMENLLNMLPGIVQKPYAPRITSPFILQKKMGELIQFLNQEKIRKEGLGMFEDKKIYVIAINKENIKVRADEANKVFSFLQEGKKYIVIRGSILLNISYISSILPFDLTKEGKETGIFERTQIFEELYPSKKQIEE